MISGKEDAINRNDGANLSPFMCSYLDYLMYMCHFSLLTDEDSIIAIENSLVNSLTLLWKIHVCMSIINKIKIGHFNNAPFEDEAKSVFTYLKKLKNTIEQYPFNRKMMKRHCFMLIEQIQLYYKEHDYIVVEPSLHVEPWLAKYIKPL